MYFRVSQFPGNPRMLVCETGAPWSTGPSWQSWKKQPDHLELVWKGRFKRPWEGDPSCAGRKLSPCCSREFSMRDLLEVEGTLISSKMSERPREAGRLVQSHAAGCWQRQVRPAIIFHWALRFLKSCFIASQEQ